MSSYSLNLRSASALAVSARRSHPVMFGLVRRLFYGVVTLFVASLLIFIATSVLPGNVAQIVMGRGADPARLRELQESLGLNDPITVRYFSWAGGILHGDLGDSAVAVAQSSPNPAISARIGGPLMNSFVLAAIATALLFPLSLALGVFSAVRAGRPTARLVSYVSLIFGCLPEFVLGTLLILIFSTQLGLLPPVYLLTPGESPLSKPSGLVLPVLTLLGVALAFTARQVRASMAVALRQEYVVMARLNGISESRVLWKYALRNALPSTVQTFAQAIQYLIGGVIVVEALFSYSGIGTLLVESVQRRDTSAVAGISIVLAAVYIAINIVADVLVTMLVPKLRTGAHS